MPELPEVETVRRGLAPHLVGAKITHVEQRRPDLRFPFPENLKERLEGATIEALERRAKYLRARLSTGETLVAHLGMTGRFLVGTGQPGQFHHAAGADDKHTHLVLTTDGGETVAFNDARRFGYVDLIRTDRLEESPWFASLGPEPLGPDFDAAVLAKAFLGKKQAIKPTLLDQRIVAGLGNIYVCEALHRARIDPDRPAGEIKPGELKRLTDAIKLVLEEAILAGGSTLNDFRHADGALGYFQHSFQVYDREEEPCRSVKCHGVVRRKVHGGRSTFFCPKCQS